MRGASEDGIQLPEIVQDYERPHAHVGLQAGLLRLAAREPLGGDQELERRAADDEHQRHSDHDLDQGKPASVGHGQHSILVWRLAVRVPCTVR